MPKTSIQSFTDDAGNGLGFLYIVDNDGTTLLGALPNTTGGLDALRGDALRNIPISSNTRAFGKIKINSITGTVDVDQINIPAGVNQIASSISITALTPTQAAEAIKNGINNLTQSPDYTATATGDTVTVFAPASIGSQGNAHTIDISFSGGGTLTTTIINPSGGSDAGSDTFRHKYFLDADYNSENSSGAGQATAGSVGPNAVEITPTVVQKSASSGIQAEVITIADGKITFERKTNIAIIKIKTESGGATDDLTDIDTSGFSEADILILVTDDAAKVPTIKSTGNIILAGSTDFALDDISKSMFVRFDLANNNFIEFERNNPLAITVANMRQANIPQSVSGTKVTTLATGGGTVDLDTGVDKGYQIFLGTGTLTASHTIQKKAADTPLDGDVFYVDYRATFTANGNDVTIFGLSLTDTQILNGNVLIKATWDNANSIYRTRLILDLSTASSIENEMVGLNEFATDRLILQSGLSAGTFTNPIITLDAQGIITIISSGSVLSAGLGAFTENMALVLTAGDLRITSANGNIFSSTNIGKVVVPSTSGIRTKVLIDVNTDTHFFVDDTGVSDIIGEEFGVTSGVGWGVGPRPFYIYACNLNNTSAGLKFAISPNPTTITVPAATNLGFHGNPAATPSDKNFFFLSSDDPVNLATKPCALIGRIRMTMSAADDWTVITDPSGIETGVDQAPFFGHWYKMQVGQMGGAANTFLKDNGGTAPVFTSNTYLYKIGRDGYVDCDILLNADGGTDGAGAVDAILALPYLQVKNIDLIIGMGTTVDVTPTRHGILCVSTGISTDCKLHDNITHIPIQNSFYANGARDLRLKLRYQAFLT